MAGRPRRHRRSPTATASPTGSGPPPTAQVDAFIDTFGGDYVELAPAARRDAERIDTIANFAAVGKYGVKAEGNAAGASADVLAELAGLIDTDQLELTIAAVYPLAEVQAAYTELERGHTRGKIVLIP